MHAIQPGERDLWPGNGPAIEMAVQDEGLGNEQDEYVQQPYADHGVHPPKVSRAEPIPKIEPRCHVEAGQASHDDGGPCLPNETVFDRLERPQAVFTQVAASDRGQRYGCSHRDPANPNDNSQDMECAGNDDVRHTRPRGRDDCVSTSSNLASKRSIDLSSNTFGRQTPYPRSGSESLLRSKLLALKSLTAYGQAMTADLHLSPQGLASADLFVGLPAPVLEIVAAVARRRRVPGGTRIFNQGDEGVRAHAVIEGGVRISQTGSDGAQVVVRFICPGEMFGTVALFTDRRYPADATAMGETVEASWSEPELLDLMTRYPQIAINAICIIGKRLQEMQNRMRELATQRAERRIAHALVRLAQQSGHSTAAGTAILFRLRRKDVADVAGTTLHTASRILTGWEKAGLLVSQHRRLTIRNTSELLRIAEEASD